VTKYRRYNEIMARRSNVCYTKRTACLYCRLHCSKADGGDSKLIAIGTKSRHCAREVHWQGGNIVCYRGDVADRSRASEVAAKIGVSAGKRIDIICSRPCEGDLISHIGVDHTSGRIR